MMEQEVLVEQEEVLVEQEEVLHDGAGRGVLGDVDFVLQAVQEVVEVLPVVRVVGVGQGHQLYGLTLQWGETNASDEGTKMQSERGRGKTNAPNGGANIMREWGRRNPVQLIHYEHTGLERERERARARERERV